MKYILTNKELSIFNTILPNLDLLTEEEIINDKQIDNDSQQELTRWQKILKFFKSNKTKVAIILASIVVLSVIVTIIIKILKNAQTLETNVNDSINNVQSIIKISKAKATVDEERDLNVLEKTIRQFRSSVDWRNYKAIRGFIGKGQPSKYVVELKYLLQTKRYEEFDSRTDFDYMLTNFLQVDKKNLSEDIINALRQAWSDKILSGTETAIYIDKVAKIVKTYPSELQFNPNEIPPFWDKTDQEWAIQTYFNRQAHFIDLQISELKANEIPEGFDKILDDWKNIRKKVVIDTAVFKDDRIKQLKMFEHIRNMIQEILNNINNNLKNILN